MSSPNTRLMPVTATISAEDHLLIGGLDTVELAERFGTPLWIMDYQTIVRAVNDCREGLAAGFHEAGIGSGGAGGAGSGSAAGASVLYAGKAFTCLAMARIVRRLGLGLDVVSEGELYTALQAGVDPETIFLHGNNKSDSELERALLAGPVTVVVDGVGELERLDSLAARLERQARILVRVTPGVEPDTHDHIKTGQADSKFGVPLEDVPDFVRRCLSMPGTIAFRGLHAHIGSQSHDIEPYLRIVDILADLALRLKEMGVEVEMLDLGGGLGIAYTEKDRPLPLHTWARELSAAAVKAFASRKLTRPHLLLEPGRSIIGPAGVTIYRAGDTKGFPSGARYVSLDGGMADNPRPATYNALYTARIASRMSAIGTDDVTTLVGRYCESGDIIIKDAGIPVRTGDLVAIFATGAYNYSMSSNYNRTGRPACVLVDDGRAELILRRETLADLIRQDLVPDWLTDD